jgi:hypothetical protein
MEEIAPQLELPEAATRARAIIAALLDGDHGDTLVSPLGRARARRTLYPHPFAATAPVAAGLGAAAAALRSPGALPGRLRLRASGGRPLRGPRRAIPARRAGPLGPGAQQPSWRQHFASLCAHRTVLLLT